MLAQDPSGLGGLNEGKAFLVSYLVQTSNVSLGYATNAFVSVSDHLDRFGSCPGKCAIGVFAAS